MCSLLAVVNLEPARWHLLTVPGYRETHYPVGSARFGAVPVALSVRFHFTLASVLAHQLFGFLDTHRYTARLWEPPPVGNVYVLLVFLGSL